MELIFDLLYIYNFAYLLNLVNFHIIKIYHKNYIFEIEKLSF